jgi:hypothetical protein
MRTDSALACFSEPDSCSWRDLVGDAGERLHVVADLVRDHVGLREFAADVEALLHQAEER